MVSTTPLIPADGEAAVPGWQPLPEPGLLLKEPGEKAFHSQNERPQ